MDSRAPAIAIAAAVDMGIPTVDLFNPLYDPELSAREYIDWIETEYALDLVPEQLDHAKQPEESPSADFLRKIYLAFRGNEQGLPIVISDDSDDTDESPQGPELAHTSKSSRRVTFAPGTFSSSPAAVADTQLQPEGADKKRIHEPCTDPSSSTSDDSFVDIQGPVKRRRSELEHDSFSFILTPADPLRLSPVSGANLASDTTAPHGVSNLALHDIDDFIKELATFFPGMRLEQRLRGIQNPSHQNLLDALAEVGLVTPKSLALFGTTKVSKISLSESLEEDATNLEPDLVHDVLGAFLVPGGFSYVEEIVLSGVKLVDRSLVRIVNLPRLAILWLDNTGIGDEGVHYLAALEPTLEELLLCDNPRITDAAIPTLSMLVAGSLRALNLRATGVGMPGIRALSKCIRDNDALVLVDIPEECEVYLHTLDTQYVVHPAAPLISDPRDVDALPTRALRINLQTHALQNTDISWQGTRRDLIDRLTTLLERRRDDFCARKAILGFEQEDDGL